MFLMNHVSLEGVCLYSRAEHELSEFHDKTNA